MDRTLATSSDARLGTLAVRTLREALTAEHKRVLIAASVGSVFEWYDFFLYGSLAGVIAAQFFSKADPSTGLIFALLAFSAGFIVRPFGAVIFGRLGDLVGRKYTFLATILLMGVSTFLVGLLPNFDAIGLLAPILLISMRLLQGLAAGGEYGGAVVYVAEFAPEGRRGYFTSWIQTTGTLAFLLSLLVILGTRLSLGEPAFAAWGWRIPFLLSIVLLAISVWIRLSMRESPIFADMKARGATSKAPLTDSFGRWENVRIMLLTLFGLTAGFGVIWYTTQFYALLFLTQTLKIDGVTATSLVLVGVLLATPFFVIFGGLSDRIGRKWLVIGGILLAAASMFPTFRALTHYGNPALEKALAESPVTVVADPADCQIQFNPTGTKVFSSSCDLAKARLVAASVAHRTENAPPGTVASIRIGDRVIPSYDARGLSKEVAAERAAAFDRELGIAIQAAGYPAKADPDQVNKPMIVALVFWLVFTLAVAYGPVAAMLVEMFPSRIRYTSMSLPYHLGTGWFGGLTPAVAFAMVAYQGDIYFGLWFPVAIALVSGIIGGALLWETRHVRISD